MPELPEVEHAAQQLAAATVGKRLAAVRTLHPAIERRLPAADAVRLAGRRVEGVERRGKYQLLRLSDDLVVVAHFRMTGSWLPGHADDTPRFARAVLEFTDGSAVFLIDSRALATLVVSPRGAEQLPAFGLDATDPSLDGVRLGEALDSRRGPIKPVLLDQAVIAGLGNIYAAEALWHARLSPFAVASMLGNVALGRLAWAVHHTIALARDDPGRYSRGEARSRLAVYGRAGEHCLRCATPIARIVQAGRSTYYCPGCQRAPLDDETAVPDGVERARRRRTSTKKGDTDQADEPDRTDRSDPMHPSHPS